MKRVALLAITAYQKYLSPYKGFCCAYRIHTGRASCSGLGLRAIRRYGSWGGLQVLRKRTSLCGVAHRRFGIHRLRPPRQQRGDCDVGGCDGDCDLPLGKIFSKPGDFLSCCDAPCDWPRRKNPPRERREAHVYLPPKRNRRPVF